jgi:cytoskeletal protein RodZ
MTDSEHSSEQNTEDSPVESMGLRLRAARENKGLTVESVAHQLNLSPQRVHDMENDEYRFATAEAYAKGYLRAYSKLLGLDPDQLVHDFDRMHYTDTIQRQETKLIVKRQISSGDRSMRWVTYSIGMVLIFLVAVWWRNQPTSTIDPEAVAAEEAATPVKIQEQDHPHIQSTDHSDGVAQNLGQEPGVVPQPEAAAGAGQNASQKPAEAPAEDPTKEQPKDQVKSDKSDDEDEDQADDSSSDKSNKTSKATDAAKQNSAKSTSEKSTSTKSMTGSEAAKSTSEKSTSDAEVAKPMAAKATADSDVAKKDELSSKTLSNQSVDQKTVNAIAKVEGAVQKADSATAKVTEKTLAKSPEGDDAATQDDDKDTSKKQSHNESHNPSKNTTLSLQAWLDKREEAQLRKLEKEWSRGRHRASRQTLSRG